MPNDKKISELPTLSQLYDNDLILVSTTDGTYNITYQSLKNAIQSNMIRNSFNTSDVGKTLVVGANGRVILSKVGTGEMIAITADKNNYTYSAFNYNADGFSEVKVAVPSGSPVDWVVDALNIFVRQGQRVVAITLFKPDEYEGFRWDVKGVSTNDAIHTEADTSFDRDNITQFTWTTAAIDITEEYFNPDE